MNNDYLSQISELEKEFVEELKGLGSLSVNLADGSEKDGQYFGYDIRPEDIEALYFEGIGIPRWDSIKADNADRQLEIYNQSMQKLMASFPQINRVNDTDQKVEYTLEQVSELQRECDRLLETVSDQKAVKALQKLAVACHKAGEHQKGLMFIPT